MAQFSGKIPPPWQARPQAAALQNSLIGQHPPSVGPIPNQQIVLGAAPQAQYAPVQQSMIQPSALGLQAITQAHIAQHSIPQPSANLVQGQASIAQVSLPQSTLAAGQVSSSLLAQPTVTPNMPTPSLVSHPQLVQSQLQIQPQVTTVSYPIPRALAPPGSFNSQPTGNLGGNMPGAGIVTAVAPNANAGGAQQPQKQRVFTGSITKLCADFGFVDEDVFFQTSCVKGTVPKVGDRVLVEASYNPNMPFKWNATRVQVIPGPINSSSNSNNRSSSLRDSSRNTNFSNVPPPNFNNENNLSSSYGNRSNLVPRSRSPRRERRDEIKRPARERDDKDKDMKRDTRKRSRSRDRSRSPVRRRPRVMPRYNVQVPKIMLYMKEANVLELRKRYSNLYVPSDVFLSRPLWSETFPAHRPFQLPRPVSFHIMNKEVDPLHENTAVYDPPDVNHSYAAKVMLMSVPPIDDVYRRSCALSEDTSDLKSGFVHPTRLINFLVGLKGKNETMAIGGYWSPSLDGSSPDKDPAVLIRTAIRTCKALTGIDLTRCTTWHRFAEIYYRRGECYHKGRLVPARLETTVLFLPDVWNVCPTKLEWDELTVSYRRQLELRLQPPTVTSEPAQSTTQQEQPASGAEEADDDDGEAKDPVKKEPTHWESLDPKTMKVLELRSELDARSMNSKGLKSQLIARLTKTLKLEQEKEEEKETGLEEEKKQEEEEKRREEEKRKKETEEKKKEDEEKRKLEEREKSLMEKRYNLPDQPMLVVHPSRTAKSGKFDCATMSLSVLLDYRQEDNKEHSFEVSLFAELFNEMLMRDFAFRIFVALWEAPDKTKDEKRDKDKKEEKKEDKEGVEEKSDSTKVEKTDVQKEDKETKKEESQEEEEEMEEEFEEEMEEEEQKDPAPAAQPQPSTTTTSRSANEKETGKSSDSKDRRKDDRKDSRRGTEKKKMVTIDPYLLLSFVYFDQTHTGYILDKDLEDIVNILGLNFSRAQLKKLISKVVSRDALYYRKLTDVLADDKTKHAGTTSFSTMVGEYEVLAKGNNYLITSINESSAEGISKNSSSNSSSKEDSECTSGEGMVKYEGSLVDIGKLMQQLERSEKARSDTEEKLKELQRELSTSKDDMKKQADRAQKLNKELKSLNSTHKTTEEELKKALEDNVEYQKALNQIKSVIRPLVAGVDLDEEDVKIKSENSKNGYLGL